MTLTSTPRLRAIPPLAIPTPGNYFWGPSVRYSLWRFLTENNPWAQVTCLTFRGGSQPRAQALSPDLARWGAFVPFLVVVPQGPSAYISLLDPTDTVWPSSPRQIADSCAVLQGLSIDSLRDCMERYHSFKIPKF
jgi:hypothetical protein